MSRSRELQQHILQLKDIRDIMNSMKNLAFMETSKLTRLLGIQHQIVENIETTASDFLNFYPYIPPLVGHSVPVYVLLGSERGFCGDFNEFFLTETEFETGSEIIAVGRKLCNRLKHNPRISAFIDGPNIAEEVPEILNHLTYTIDQIQKKSDSIVLTVMYQEFEKNRLLIRQLLPPFQQSKQKTVEYSCPPVLNMEPADFLAELVDHYLFAVFHEIFYTSLMAENQRRFRHMEGAVRHLDDETVKLTRESNIFRQEEITEEIEVILLTAEALTGR